MSLFANATKVETKKVAAKKTKNEVTVPGLRHVAMIDALIKSLGTIQTTLAKEVKDFSFDQFFDTVVETGKKPESFRGVDGIASASLECRKRGTNSPLTPDEVTLLTKSGLVVTEQVIVQEMFGFNPDYINDTKMFDTISAALEPLIAAGKLPKDLIAKQDKVSKMVVSDDTLEAACRLKHKLPREVLQTLTTMAIKPKLEVTDLAEIFREVEGLVVPAATATVTKD